MGRGVSYVLLLKWDAAVQKRIDNKLISNLFSRFFDKYREINCDLECRMLKVLELCDCLPYYFETIERIPVCNFRQIKCLVDHYGWLQFNLKYRLYLFGSCVL